VIDLPGHGQSTLGLAGKRIRKFEDVADMIVETMKEHGIVKATFMAVSLGTLVVAGILSKYAEMVSSVILCGAVSGINISLKCLLKIANKFKFCMPYTFILKVISKILLPLDSHQLTRKFFLKTGEEMGRKEFLAWCDLVVADLDVLKRLNTWVDNILFVSGDEDYTFLSGVQTKFKSLHKGSLQIMQGCGHVCNIQKWREFNEISLQFMQGLPVS
jgi:pimeloyl-ACP methyl ester carboxylesterase